MPERRAYEEITRVGKALASPRRLELLDLLAQGPRAVDELASLCELSLANASQHLKILREAKLVDTRRQGRQVVCSLAPGVSSFLVSLRGLAERRLPALSALARDLAGDDSVDPMNARHLLQQVEEGRVVVLDVRPRDEYRAGHLRGSRSIPLDQLRGRLAELSRDHEIVAYCRGPWCLMARDAVHLLREHGYVAKRLELGVADFRTRGLPVDEDAA